MTINYVAKELQFICIYVSAVSERLSASRCSCRPSKNRSLYFSVLPLC